MNGRIDGSGFFVGLDLGGTKIAAARVSPDGTLGEIHKVPTPGQEGAEAILDACAEAIRKAISGETGELLGIGVGSAGTIDATTGTVVAATEVLKGWTGTNISEGLRDRVAELTGQQDIHVAVENDVNAHALGESWLGAGKGKSSAVVLALGTGIGGAVVLNNTVLGGARHAGGDFGHIPSSFASGYPCTCGKTGRLEAVASGPSIARLYNNEVEHAGLTPAEDTREVFNRARAGESTARAVLSWAARGVAEGLAAISCVVDPEVIVLAGSLAHSWESFTAEIKDYYRELTVHGHNSVEILEATLEDGAAILGGVRHLLNSSSANHSLK